LRGFRDYRFRDRDLVLLQTEYLRQVYGPVDFIAFYDTGKVAPSISRLDEGRLRHTYGLGIVVAPRRGENVLFRFYVALGSGEGSHTFFGVGDALGGRADRLIR
jgi:outer membrane translocation and assembly module TamA